MIIGMIGEGKKKGKGRREKKKEKKKKRKKREREREKKEREREKKKKKKKSTLVSTHGEGSTQNLGGSSRATRDSNDFLDLASLFIYKKEGREGERGGREVRKKRVEWVEKKKRKKVKKKKKKKKKIKTSLRRTASSTAISQKGFIAILTLSVTTPVFSPFTRILAA